uniref:DDE Tnp4 domain-containing protein n=1 Tax=Magallana gigas TaxID=29159 RepID=A0A8W8MP63_MAGGI
MPCHFVGEEVICSDQTTITMTDTSSMHTSPPSINASVTTDNKRTSAGVLIDTHTHRTLSTVTHTQVQRSSRATRSHTQTSTPVADTHDHTSTGCTLTHPRISTPVIGTQDLTSITPKSSSTVNISTVNTSTPVSISHPAEKTNTTDKQNIDPGEEIRYDYGDENTPWERSDSELSDSSSNISLPSLEEFSTCANDEDAPISISSTDSFKETQSLHLSSQEDSIVILSSPESVSNSPTSKAYQDLSDSSSSSGHDFDQSVACEWVVTAVLIDLDLSLCSKPDNTQCHSLVGKAGNCIKFPRDVSSYKSRFFEIAGFPNVVGCVDGTQIKIKAPNVNEGEYVNRKGFHSLNVQMVCGPDFCITNVVAKWPGSVHDSRIFKESVLCREFENGHIQGMLLVVACCVLHNIGINRGDIISNSDDNDLNVAEDVDGVVDMGGNGKTVRDHIARNYF